MHRRNLTLAATAAALALVVLPSAANATDVCNEAENSYRGGYTVSGDPVDPNPPARLRAVRARRCASATATARAWSTPPSTRRRCAPAAPATTATAAAAAARTRSTTSC